jgi:hypothetical protein
MAAYPGYEHITYVTQNAVTFDGKWTSTTEWTDGGQTSISANTVFRSKWGPFVSMDDPLPQYLLVEILNDNTNDPGDYWQICLDADQSGGTAPAAGDVRIDIVGHNTATFYQGNGTGWAPSSAYSSADFQWSNSISASPTSSTPHWICEIKINKFAAGLGILYNFRIAAYDASNAVAGPQAWPPTSRDVPNDWGIMNYSGDPIPESLTFGVFVLLSSVAVVVGSYYLRKRPKTTIITPMKL